MNINHLYHKFTMDSDSEDYFKSWIRVTNRVKDRLKDGSLVHTFSSKRRIAESTKEFNKYSKKFSKLHSYKQFLECKKGILEKVSEDKVVTDESDFSQDDYIQYYNSFHNSDVKFTGKFNWFSWNEVYKNSKYFKSIDSKEDTNCHSLDAINNVSIATKSEKVLNVKKFDNKQRPSKIVQYESNSLVEKQSKSKSNQSSKLLNNNANDSDTSSSNNVGSNNENKKGTRRASSVKKVEDLENSSSKKITTRKRSTNVKRNLTSVLNNVDSKVIEPLDEDDWNDEFIASDFVAQSTQICSDTFSEINQRKTRKSLNIFKLAQNEKVNQPRDSGIEEDSREDNLNNDSLTNNKKISNEKKKNLEDKISDDKKSESKECNFEHKTQENNSNNNVLLGTDRDSLIAKNKICTHKKLPLKVKEEKITKKYTIISKGDIKLKPVEEETSNQTSNLKSDDKAKENNESKNKYVETQITESDKNIEIKEEDEEESNDDYHDLRDYGTEEDSNDDKNNSEAENDISVDQAVPLNRSTKTKLKKEKKYKNELKNKLKRCKSPFMKQKFKELNQLGLLSESEVDMGPSIVNKENKETEENIEKPYFSLTPIDIESITNDTTFGENSKNKSEKLKTHKASDEDATVSKESTDNDTKMTHNKSNEKYEKEDDEQDLSHNSKKHLQQMKKLDFSKNIESFNDSQDENINKKLTEKSGGNLILPSSKKYNEQMKKMGLDSSNEKNRGEYNNTKNVEKSQQNFLTKVDDDEQDLSQNGKRHLQQIKKLDFFKNSESSDSEDENINKTSTKNKEENLKLPNSTKYNEQMKRMGLDSSSEDSDDSSNGKKVMNEEEINKSNDKKGKDKNKKNISKSEGTSQSENRDEYNTKHNTKNVEKSEQNFLTKVDDDELDLSQNGKRHLQQMKKLDFFKNSESSDSEDENINKTSTKNKEDNLKLQNSTKYNEQMKRLGLDSSSEDSDDSSNGKKVTNEKEINKSNDKKRKDKNKKNISKSEGTSQSENRDEYNSTKNVVKSEQNFLTKVDDDEQDLSQNGKKHLQQMKKLDFFKNSENSDSEDENINKTSTKNKEENLKLPNSTKYNEQMKRMGLDSSSEDSDDSSNGKKVMNEEEINKSNDKKGKDKNKKNTSKSENKDKYNNTENVKNTGQSFNTSNIQDDLISNTISPQLSESISKSSNLKDTKKIKNRLIKNKTEEISSSREQSYEIEKQEELTKVVENYKKSIQSKSKSDDSNAEKKNSLHTKKDHQKKKLDHGNDKAECSEEGNLTTHGKKKLSINNKINVTKHSKKEDKSIDNTTKLHTTSEESEDDTISSNPKPMLQKLRKKYDQVNSSENSNPTEKLNVINSADCDSNIDIEEHKIVDENKIPEAIKIIHQDNSNSSVMNENSVAMVRKLECNKSDKESSCSTSQNIDVEHCSSEAETSNKRKRKKNYNSDSSEKDKEIDVVTLSPKVLKHLKKFKGYNISEESEEDSDNDELIENLNEDKHKNSINDTGSTNLIKMVINSSDDESDNDESDREMSPSTKQRLKQYKKMNLVCSSNSSSSDDENIIAEKNKISTNSLVKKNDSEKQKWLKKTHLFDSDSESIKSEKSNLSQKNNKSDVYDVFKKKSPNKSNSTKGHINSKKADTKINDTIDDIEDEKTHNNSKNIIICETQDSEPTQKELESQDLFSSLEDLTKGVNQDISKLAEGSELDSNTEIANQIPPTQQCKKIYTKRITEISELVEKEDLSEGSYESTMTLNDISAHEEIFILEVPKIVFSDGDLIGKKMTFSKTTLMFGDNNMYEAFERNVSPKYSCVFKSENNTKNSFEILNVRPTTEIVARRKKHLDDSNKQGDLECNEENEQSKISLRVSKKGHTAVKTEVNASKKLHKKKSNAEDEKEIKKTENEKRKRNEVLQNSKTKRDKFHLSNFVVEKTTTMLMEEHKLSEEESDSEIKLSIDSDKDSIKDEKDEKDDKVLTNISNNICPKPKKSKTSVGKAANVDLDKETNEKRAKVESKSGIAKVKVVNKKSSNTNARKDNKESDKKSKPLINQEKKSKNQDTNEIKTEVKKESKQKKLKTAVTEDKPETNEPTAGPSSGTPAKKPKTPKKKANNESKPTKRKAETKASDDAVVNTKKRKIAAEKKPKSPAVTNKTTAATKPSKKTTTAKNKKPPMADAAAKEILNLIQKTMKFNTEKLDSSNSSLDNSKYGALDIERVPAKNKYASTTSSSDEEGKFSRHSFQVRSKPEVKESESSSSDDDKDKVDVKEYDKKKKKKTFFFDE